MIRVLIHTWPLLAGIMLLMLGNGIQSTLIGVRGVQEGFSTGQMSLIMSGYFLGFLGGSRLAPLLIMRVGHVRVFAALGSLISASLILYAEFTDPIFWMILRVIIGFCFSGVYVVAESWLNDTSTNETRGQTLSVYIVVQMIGVVTAQGMLNLGDTRGYYLFIISSVLVSLSFAPILLSVSPAPLFQAARPMKIKDLLIASPLGALGSFCLGAVFSALWGMSAVFGIEANLSVAQISFFVGSIYLGGLLFQYPIGRISDRVDRRVLISSSAGVCAAATLAAGIYGSNFPILIVCSLIIGGTTIPLYSLLIAYTNDYLGPEDMPSAAGGLIFLNGLGAIGGPLFVGWLMEVIGIVGFFAYIGLVMAFLAAFCLFRMTLRPLPSDHEAQSYAPVSPTSTPVAVDMAQDFSAELQQEEPRDHGMN